MSALNSINFSKLGREIVYSTILMDADKITKEPGAAASPYVQYVKEFLENVRLEDSTKAMLQNIRSLPAAGSSKANVVEFLLKTAIKVGDFVARLNPDLESRQKVFVGAEELLKEEIQSDLNQLGRIDDVTSSVLSHLVSDVLNVAIPQIISLSIAEEEEVLSVDTEEFREIVKDTFYKVLIDPSRNSRAQLSLESEKRKASKHMPEEYLPFDLDPFDECSRTSSIFEGQAASKAELQSMPEAAAFKDSRNLSVLTKFDAPFYDSKNTLGEDRGFSKQQAEECSLSPLFNRVRTEHVSCLSPIQAALNENFIQDEIVLDIIEQALDQCSEEKRELLVSARNTSDHLSVAEEDLFDLEM